MERKEHLRLLKEDLEEAKVFYKNEQYSFILPTLKALWARAVHNKLCETPSGLESGLKLASCYYQLGDFIEAHRTLTAVKQNCKSDDPEVILCEIFALNDFGEFQSAANLAAELETKFASLDGAQKDLQYESRILRRENFAASLIESGQTDEAIAILGSILRTKSYRLSALKLKAKALIDQGDWETAGHVTKLLKEKEDPASAETKELCAIVRINLGGKATLENDPHPSLLEKNVADIQGQET